MKIALYLRYSSDNQDDATIETQRAECTEKAVRLWPESQIVTEYVDTAQSGKVENRPEFQRMIADSKKTPRPWDVLMVRKYDRFARDVTVSRVYKTMLRRQGIKVISAREDIDTDSTTGRLLEVIIEAVAAFYSENLAMETRSGMITNTKKGFRCGGTAPYGYQNKRVIDQATGKERTVLVIQEEEAIVVQNLFDMMANGFGLKKAITELTARGFRPRKAKAWSQGALFQLLRYETYRGNLVWRSKSGTVISEGAAPRIIDEETWNKVQARLAANAKQTPRLSGSPHPLSGLIFCGVCGAPYIVRGITRGEFRLCCANRHRHLCENQNRPEESAIVDAIRNEILQNHLNRKTIESVLKEFAANQEITRKKTQVEAGVIRKRIAQVDQKISVMLDELAKGDIPRNLVVGKLEEFRQEKDRQQKALDEIPQIPEDCSELPIGDIEEIIALVKRELSSAGEPELKEVFHALQLRVEVHKDHLKILTSPLSERRAYTVGAGSGT